MPWGDFHVCAFCYSQGKTCNEPLNHKVRRVSCAGIYFQYNETDLLRLQTAAQTGSAERFFNIIRDTAVCRIWFSTTQGNVGSGPATMQEGDVVAILFGARVPFILRPEPNGNSRYHIVGDCYIDGMMDGEATQKRGSSKMRTETFRMC